MTLRGDIVGRMPKRTELIIEVKGLPVSVNNAIRYTRNGRSYKTKEYRDWTRRVNKLGKHKIKKSKWYGFDLELYFPIHYKNGNVRKKDRSNFLKYAEDCIFKNLTTYEGIEIDDSQILEGNTVKIDSEEEKTIITIYCI